MNLFIEGLQGTGKSTLTNRLSQAFPEYTAYREGDYSPVELAWCAYMRRNEWSVLLKKYEGLHDEIMTNTHTEGSRQIVTYTRVLAENRQFYRDMEEHEIYNARVSFGEFRRIILGRYQAYRENGGIFECSFFQNSIESMMLFYCMPEEQIMQFYQDAFDALKEKDFLLLYLDDAAVKENTLQIKKERCDVNGVELWFPLMMEYLKNSPYGEEHHYTGLEDLVAHLERRRRLELQIIKEILKDKALILPAKRYDFDSVREMILQEARISSVIS